MTSTERRQHTGRRRQMRRRRNPAYRSARWLSGSECHQAWRPEDKPWNPHGGRREMTEEERSHESKGSLGYKMRPRLAEAT